VKFKEFWKKFNILSKETTSSDPNKPLDWDKMILDLHDTAKGILDDTEGKPHVDNSTGNFENSEMRLEDPFDSGVGLGTEKKTMKAESRPNYGRGEEIKYEGEKAHVQSFNWSDSKNTWLYNINYDKKNRDGQVRGVVNVPEERINKSQTQKDVHDAWPIAAQLNAMERAMRDLEDDYYSTKNPKERKFIERDMAKLKAEMDKTEAEMNRASKKSQINKGFLEEEIKQVQNMLAVINRRIIEAISDDDNAEYKTWNKKLDEYEAKLERLMRLKEMNREKSLKSIASNIDKFLDEETDATEMGVNTDTDPQKMVGVDYAGPVPSSKLAEQDLEGGTSSTEKHGFQLQRVIDLAKLMLERDRLPREQAKKKLMEVYAEGHKASSGELDAILDEAGYKKSIKSIIGKHLNSFFTKEEKKPKAFDEGYRAIAHMDFKDAHKAIEAYWNGGLTGGKDYGAEYKVGDGKDAEKQSSDAFWWEGEIKKLEAEIKQHEETASHIKAKKIPELNEKKEEFFDYIQGMESALRAGMYKKSQFDKYVDGDGKRLWYKEEAGEKVKHAIKEGRNKEVAWATMSNFFQEHGIPRSKFDEIWNKYDHATKSVGDDMNIDMQLIRLETDKMKAIHDGDEEKEKALDEEINYLENKKKRMGKSDFETCPECGKDKPHLDSNGKCTECNQANKSHDVDIQDKLEEVETMVHDMDEKLDTYETASGTKKSQVEKAIVVVGVSDDGGKRTIGPFGSIEEAKEAIKESKKEDKGSKSKWTYSVEGSISNKSRVNAIMAKHLDKFFKVAPTEIRNWLSQNEKHLISMSLTMEEIVDMVMKKFNASEDEVLPIVERWNDLSIKSQVKKDDKYNQDAHYISPEVSDEIVEVTDTNGATPTKLEYMPK
jgi:hypothetical protein